MSSENSEKEMMTCGLGEFRQMLRWTAQWGQNVKLHLSFHTSVLYRFLDAKDNFFSDIKCIVLQTDWNKFSQTYAING